MSFGENLLGSQKAIINYVPTNLLAGGGICYGAFGSYKCLQAFAKYSLRFQSAMQLLTAWHTVNNIWVDMLAYS